MTSLKREPSHGLMGRIGPTQTGPKDSLIILNTMMTMRTALRCQIMVCGGTVIAEMNLSLFVKNVKVVGLHMVPLTTKSSKRQ